MAATGMLRFRLATRSCFRRRRSTHPPSKSRGPSSVTSASPGASKPSIALLNEYDENRHWRRTFIIDVDDQQPKPRLLWDLSTDEKYANPGDPVKRQLANGSRWFARTAIRSTLRDIGSSPDGDRPFLDRLDLKTLKSERLFRSDKTCLRAISFLHRAGREDVPHLASIADRPAECVCANAGTI